MANRTHRMLAGSPSSDVVILNAALAGNTTSNPTIPDAGGEILTATRTDTGDVSLTFRHAYPELLFASIAVAGTTAGLTARFVTLDVSAKTATITCEVAATPTDPATTDTIRILLVVRNSAFNR